MLNRLEKGIYGKSIANTNEIGKRDISIIVHPFFLRGELLDPTLTIEDKNIIRKTNKEYEKKLKTYLVDLKNPLIIFEEEYRVWDTFHEISEINEDITLIFIPTWEGNHTPYRTNWYDIVKFINSIWSKQNPISSMGGYYRPEDLEDKGCLGNVKLKLENFNFTVKVIDNLTVS